MDRILSQASGSLNLSQEDGRACFLFKVNHLGQFGQMEGICERKLMQVEGITMLIIVLVVDTYIIYLVLLHSKGKRSIMVGRSIESFFIENVLLTLYPSFHTWTGIIDKQVHAIALYSAFDGHFTATCRLESIEVTCRGLEVSARICFKCLCTVAFQHT